MHRRPAHPPTLGRNHTPVVQRAGSVAVATAIVTAWSWHRAGLLAAVAVLAWIVFLSGAGVAIAVVAAAERRRRAEWRLIAGRRAVSNLLDDRRAR